MSQNRPDQTLAEQSNSRADAFTEELVLRLVDVQAVIASIDPEAAERVDEEAAGLLSALDYALRGECGCLERDEWQDMRRQALAKHGDYLGLGWRS
jgi:hypothetical protein